MERIEAGPSLLGTGAIVSSMYINDSIRGCKVDLNEERDYRNSDRYGAINATGVKLKKKRQKAESVINRRKDWKEREN